MGDKIDYHARGEKDGAEGRYHEPHGPLTLLTSSDIDDDIKDNKEYEAGYDNAKKQRR